MAFFERTSDSYKMYICFMFESINQYATRCGLFSDNDLKVFNKLLEVKTLPKKTFLLKEGQICNYEYYVNKGCLRSFFLEQGGNEVTLQFAIEEWWISDIASFNERSPSRMFIETLEESEVLLLSFEAKERLLKQAPAFERLFRLMLQRHVARLQERLFLTIANTATEKYLDFIARYPTIPQRVAQHYIASYLGFSPEFLSKVRTRLAKNK